MTLILERRNGITSRYLCRDPLFIFTALHGMQGSQVRRKLSVSLSVRLSVCLSVKRMQCDKTGERSVQILIPHVTREII